MKNIRITLLLWYILILNSCNFLDVESEGIIPTDTYYKTEKQLNIALNGVYATLADYALYGNNMLGRMALDGDEGYENFVADENQIGYYVVSSEDIKILHYWRVLYAGINRANLLLENIDNPTMNESKRNSIKGESLFLRGYFYFMLVSRFGDIPLILKSTESSKSEDLQKIRTSTKDVYEQILKDMETASELVLDASSYNGGGRVSKSAVWGILSRVNLYMAGEPLNDHERYNDAAKWAKMVIDYGHHELNPSYENVFIKYAQDQYDIKESIWEVEFWGDNTTAYRATAGMVGRNNGIRCDGNFPSVDSIGYSGGYLYATTVLYDLYDRDIPFAASGVKDLRRNWAIAPFRYQINNQTGAITEIPLLVTNIYIQNCGKFRRINETGNPKSRAATPINFPLLRYSDVLLMYAEAVNQKSIKDASEQLQAYETLNMVRRRGFGLSVVTPHKIDIIQAQIPMGQDFLAVIQNERARELCFETLRSGDLKRWGIFYPKMKYALSIIPPTWSSTAVARTVFGNVTQRDVIWPIPSYELANNKLLTQNNGW